MLKSSNLFSASSKPDLKEEITKANEYVTSVWQQVEKDVELSINLSLDLKSSNEKAMELKAEGGWLMNADPTGRLIFRLSPDKSSIEEAIVMVDSKYIVESYKESFYESTTNKYLGLEITRTKAVLLCALQQAGKLVYLQELVNQQRFAEHKNEFSPISINDDVRYGFDNLTLPYIYGEYYSNMMASKIIKGI